MAKLDFNQINRPTLDLTMCDPAQTRITVVTPTEGLVEELEALRENVATIFSADTPEGVDACYNLAARLISCNRQGLQVSVEDLKTKYWPTERMANQLYLLTFLKAYNDFIDELRQEKN